MIHRENCFLQNITLFYKTYLIDTEQQGHQLCKIPKIIPYIIQQSKSRSKFLEKDNVDFSVTTCITESLCHCYQSQLFFFPQFIRSLSLNIQVMTCVDFYMGFGNVSLNNVKNFPQEPVIDRCSISVKVGIFSKKFFFHSSSVKLIISFYSAYTIIYFAFLFDIHKHVYTDLLTI